MQGQRPLVSWQMNFKMAKKLSETTGTTEEFIQSCVKIDKLSVTFNSDDMNKVVEKINEIIEKQALK